MHNYSYGVKVRHFSKLQSVKVAKNTPKVNCIDYSVFLEPSNDMGKILFTIDELIGIIFAVAKMRPSKSCKDMEFSSLKKKFKDKKFAAGCSRDVIKNGAEKYMGAKLDVVLDKTLSAMRDNEDKIKKYL